MSFGVKSISAYVERQTSLNEDDKELEALGYKPSFKREFSNLATISFAFSIIGLCSTITTTFNIPLALGGPATVVWAWIIGACMVSTLGTSIAEIVSAYPTCGGLYTASAQLTPKKYRATIGWLVGWLNILGQVAGVASVEFGLSMMIMAGVSIGTDNSFVVTQKKIVGLFVGLLIVHGLLNSLATRALARMVVGMMFVNIGGTILIIIVLLATTARSDMHPANYVFGSDGIINGTGGWNTGLAFLFGLISVQFTMTDYDGTAHIAEEVRHAAYAAPAAIFIAVIGTGILGWLFNIVLILCSGPLENLPGPSGSAVLAIMALRMGKVGSLILWVFVCATGFFVVQTALQALSRTMYAFSRDHGLPDGGFFGINSRQTFTPLRSVWLCTFISILPGLLDLANPVVANAIFSLCAVALDLSYVICIICRRVFAKHPEVMFKPGPFYMGDGLLGWFFNINCIVWTIFVCIILSLPTLRPVTASNMNYAGVIAVAVVGLSFIWYFASARKHYHGPQPNIENNSVEQVDQTNESEEKEKEEYA